MPRHLTGHRSQRKTVSDPSAILSHMHAPCCCECACMRFHLGKQRLGLEAGLEVILRPAMLPLKTLPGLAEAELASILQLFSMASLVQAASLPYIVLPQLHCNVACPGLYQPVAPWAGSGHASKSEPGEQPPRRRHSAGRECHYRLLMFQNAIGIATIVRCGQMQIHAHCLW